MNKELKLLIISLILLIIGIGYIYMSQHQKCYEVGYQDLSGSHSKTICEWSNE